MTGKSSTLPTDEETAGLEAAACPAGRSVALGRVAVEDAATVETEGRGEAAVGVAVLPLAPTVTHAPLLVDVWADGAT